jgi:hypothetical protein
MVAAWLMAALPTHLTPRGSRAGALALPSPVLSERRHRRLARRRMVRKVGLRPTSASPPPGPAIEFWEPTPLSGRPTNSGATCRREDHPMREGLGIEECYRRAAEARRIAEAPGVTEAEKSDLLEVERRWLSLARGQARGRREAVGGSITTRR